MDADDHRDGGREHSLSEGEKIELEVLDIAKMELQAEYDRLYVDYKSLLDQHRKTVKIAEELECKYREMDSRVYRKQWRKLYEEEMVCQELAASIRQYAEEVRKRREEVLLLRIRYTTAC